MALNAARTDVTISLVGEDETQQMLQAAQANMQKLEGQLKSLTNTTNIHASAAKSADSPMKTFNGGLSSAATVADSAISGIDKVNGVIGKFMSIASTGAPIIMALTGVVALLGIEFDSTGRMVTIFTDSMNSASRAALESVKDFKATLGSLEKIRPSRTNDEASLDWKKTEIRLLRAMGKEKAAVAIEGEIVELEARVKRDKALEDNKELNKKETDEIEDRSKKYKISMNNLNDVKDSAVTALFFAKAKVFETQKLVDNPQFGFAVSYYKNELAKAKTDVAKIESNIVLFTGQIEDLKKTGAESLKEINNNFDNRRYSEPDIESNYQNDILIGDAENKKKKNENLKEYLKKREEMKKSHRKRQEETRKKYLDEGGSYFAEVESANEKHNDTMKKIATQKLADEKEANDKTKKEEEKIRKEEEKIRKEKEKIKKEEDKQKKQREEQIKGILEFANVLKGSLIPELSAVSEVISKITDQFDLFTEGKMKLNHAIAASVTEIAAASARALGGIKEEAAVRAVFELGMGFATLANPYESAGHFTAAAILGGFAAGVITIPSEAAAAKEKKEKEKALGTVSNAVSSNGSSTGNSGGSGGVNINNYNLSTGVIDGQSTTRAFRRAEQQSRNTGWAMNGGW